MLPVTPSLGIFLADAIHLSALGGRRMMQACSVPSSVRKCTEEPWTDHRRSDHLLNCSLAGGIKLIASCRNGFWSTLARHWGQSAVLRLRPPIEKAPDQRGAAEGPGA